MNYSVVLKCEIPELRYFSSGMTRKFRKVHPELCFQKLTRHPACLSGKAGL
jgi:predicted RNase H-like nuclease